MPIDKSKISKEMLAKAAMCETAEELIALAKTEGMEITKAEAEAYLSELDNVELLENYQRLSDLKKHIEAKMQSILGLRTKVTLVAPKTIERFQGKAKRIVDLRNQ